MKKKTKEIKKRVEKLTMCEFFDVYGISLILYKDIHNKYCQYRLLELADKYIKITKQALRAELRHLLGAGGLRPDNNRELLDKMNLYTNWKERRLKVTSKQALKLFRAGNWTYDYGGKAWTEIAETIIKLENYRKELNYNYICSYIDRLNDLEHNNALYLQTYSSFNLEEALDFKAEALPVNIFYNCHSDIADIGRELYDPRITE